MPHQKAEHDREALLEEALIEYVERYGLSDKARVALAAVCLRHESGDSFSKPVPAQGKTGKQFGIP